MRILPKTCPFAGILVRELLPQNVCPLAVERAIKQNRFQLELKNSKFNYKFVEFKVSTLFSVFLKKCVIFLFLKKITKHYLLRVFRVLLLSQNWFSVSTKSQFAKWCQTYTEQKEFSGSINSCHLFLRRDFQTNKKSTQIHRDHSNKKRDHIVSASQFGASEQLLGRAKSRNAKLSGPLKWPCRQLGAFPAFWHQLCEEIFTLLGGLLARKDFFLSNGFIFRVVYGKCSDDEGVMWVLLGVVLLGYGVWFKNELA